MAKAKAKVEKATDPQTDIELRLGPGESPGAAMTRTMLGPELRHGHIASTYAGAILGAGVERPGLMDTARYVKDQGDKVASGDLGMVSRMLAAQAITLDSMFTELARRSTLNMGEFLDASDRYARLALKAQSNCRSTLEALAKLHQPREQTVRHVHVGRGGQAVVADEFHHHGGGVENESAEQSHATAATGASPALPCPDPLGDAVPVSGRIGEATLQDARRQ